jgi:hypothetical protein
MSDDRKAHDLQTEELRIVLPAPAENPPEPPSAQEEVAVQEDAVRAQARRRTRRSFLVGTLSAIGLAGAWRWILTRPQIEGVPGPLRKAFDFNAAVSRALLGDRALAPTFAKGRAVQDLRVNGVIGLDPALRLDRWRLQVKNLARAEGSPEYVADVNTWKYADDPVLMAQDDTLDTYVEGDGNLDRSNGKPDGPEPGLLLTMDAIRALPKVEMVTQLKCIEGWSEIVEWGGARMSDFMHAYPPARGANGRLPRYVGFETPDRQYYVGLYMEDALHPQTLLCYEINGQPLSREHGAPLRLVTPLKYGIKHLKQIGSISYTDKRPRDYWAENDYDYYAGH